MGNENRLQLMLLLCSPLMFCVAILYNYLGSPQFREYIFMMELFGAVVGVIIAVLVMTKYLRVWFIDELRIVIAWKCLCALFIIVSNIYFIDLLMEWMWNKSYDCITIEVDQQWASWQLTLLILFIGGNLGSLIDFDNILSIRIVHKLGLKNFGQTALEMGKITKENLNKLEAELDGWRDDFRTGEVSHA